MSIMRAVLSLFSWFVELPGVNGDEASGDPRWETASEYKSWKVWAAPLHWTCCVENTLEAGTGPQEGLTSYLGPGLGVCAELLNSCGAWRGRSSGCVSPHPDFWEGEDTEWLGNCLLWLYFCQPKAKKKSSCLFRSWQREFLHLDDGCKNTELM